MTLFLAITTIVLLGLFALGLVRIYIGPSQADRILAVQLSGTTTVAILIVLSALMEMTALLHAALLFVLFAALIAVAFVRHPQSED